MKGTLLQAAAVALIASSSAVAADPWADAVVEYIPGANLPSVFGSDPPVYFDQATAALGEPTRQSVAFGGYVVSPFSSPSDPSEAVALGEGGSLTVAFDEPVTNDPLNPFGVDLLVFGNAFFLTSDFNFDDGTTVSGVASEGGLIEISADGVTFVPVTGVDADGLFPTNGYADAVDFFPAAPGGVLTDFTLPVDPAFDPTGLGVADLLQGYAGSGGGAGIDIGAYGLQAVSFVRVTNPVNSGVTPEIDGFADVRAVPEPSAIVLVLFGAALTRGRR